MKTLLFLSLVFAVVTGELHENGKYQLGKKHGIEHYSHILKSISRTNIPKHKQKTLKTVHSRMYKKYAMLAPPLVPLEDTSPSQSQPQQVPQIVMPVGMTQGSSQEMASSYTNSLAQPSTLGQPDSQSQVVSNPAEQPATVQYQVGQQQADQGTTQQDEGSQPQVDPNAGVDTTQSFAPQTTGNGDEIKPQISGATPQDEVKVVNLGDDEKAANAQTVPCGGCPPGAKCVNGECQIHEQDAQAQTLAGKGSPSNPGTVNNIQSLETQELKTLLKEASKADPPPGQSPQGTTPSLEQTTASPDKFTTSSEDTTATPETTTTMFADSVPSEPLTQPQATNQEAKKEEFSDDQIKELRNFARMYKMYQFIRKMEKRLNDPDCAPVCHKTCKQFCPTKCCHHHYANATQPGAIMQTVTNLSKTGNYPGQTTGQSLQKVDATLDEDEGDKEENEMNGEARKKHLFVKIEKK